MSIRKYKNDTLKFFKKVCGDIQEWGHTRFVLTMEMQKMNQQGILYLVIDFYKSF